MQTVSDEELMHLVKSGDKLAFNTLMERWELGVKGFLSKFALNHHDIEDCAQQTFINLYFHANKFDHECKFKPWVLGIAANEAKSKLRWIRVRNFVTLTHETAVDPQTETREVHESLEGLNPENRLICTLRLEGYENREIAASLKISMRSLERKLAKIRGGLELR